MRFEEILNCVAGAECSILADIGTDHAYIPIEAVKRKLTKKAIACDIAPGPLEIGEKNVIKEGLTEHVELRLGDGLTPINANEADVIVIAGMGGHRMLGIIANGIDKICSASLILQPQHDLSKLRRGLNDLSIKIDKEILAKEGERFYEILCAKKTPKVPKLTEKEAFLGSYAGELAQLFYLHKKQKIEKYIHCISDDGAKQQACKELKWLEQHQDKYWLCLSFR